MPLTRDWAGCGRAMARLFLSTIACIATALMLQLPAQAAVLTVPIGGNLQTAVNNASPGDVIRLAGNPSANVTVDLALMGSAVGSGPGDLTIVGVNGASATLLGGNGSRLVYTSGTPFPGVLTLDGLTFSTSASTTSPAVRLENMGTLIINNVVFDGIGAEGCPGGFTGCTGLSVSFQSGTGLLAIRGSTLRNIARDAIRVDVSGGNATIVVESSLITDNAINSAIPDTGIFLSVSNAANAWLTVQSNTISNLTGPAVYTVSGDSSVLQSSVVSNTITDMPGLNPGTVVHETAGTANTAVVRASVTDNTFSNLPSTAILGRLLGSGATMELNASRNQMNAVGTAGAGNHGILARGVAGATGQLTLLASNNVIDNVGASGLRVVSNDANVQARVVGNTVTNTNQIASASDAAIYVLAGTPLGGPYTLQAKIEGNTLDAQGLVLDDQHANADLRIETNGSAALTWLNASNTYSGGGVAALAAGTAAIAGLNSTASLTENRPPSAVQDSLGAVTGITNTLNVMANDTDPDADVLQLLGFQAVSLRGGAVTRLDGGTPANLADDQLGFTPLLTGTGSDRVVYVVRDPGGRASVHQVTLNVVNDSTPPDTTITAAPATPGTATTVTFQFSGSDNVTATALTFGCRLYPAAGVPPAFAACTSPFTAGALADGAYVFETRATDAAGNVDATPASHAFTVDTVAPTATINANPAAATNSTSANFGFTGADPGGSGVAAFQCSLDAGAFAACTSPQAYAGLTEATHIFRVRARDNAGNTGVAATFTWVVDLTAPDTTITAAPPAASASTNASFSFSGSDAGSGVASFECSLDGGVFTACTSPQNYAGLSEGNHTFQVRAVDAAGNVDGSAAVRAWVVDTTAPAAPVVTTPANGATVTTTLPTLGGTAEPAATVRVLVDSVVVGTVTANGAGNWSLTVPSALTNGTHTVSAFAIDAAGNTSPSSATTTFRVNTALTLAATTGGGQSAVASTAFAVPLGVHVSDGLGASVAGRTVSFVVPAGTPTAVLSAASCVTNASGDCSVGATATASVGSFNVTATVAGGASPAVFVLTITAPPAAAAGLTAVPVSGLPGLVLLALAMAGLGAWRSRSQRNDR